MMLSPVDRTRLADLQPTDVQAAILGSRRCAVEMSVKMPNRLVAAFIARTQKIANENDYIHIKMTVKSGLFRTRVTGVISGLRHEVVSAMAHLRDFADNG